MKRWSGGKNSLSREGNLYGISRKESLMCLGGSALICLALALTFYQSLLAVFLTLPICFVLNSYLRNRLIQKKKHRFIVEFKDAMEAIASALQAGYSLERSFKEAHTISIQVYGPDSSIANLLRKVNSGLQLNMPMDQLMDEMAKRSNLEEVQSFTDVIRVTRRYGGNLPEMIRNLVVILEDKLAVRAEIMAVTTSIRYESYMMDLIPAGIIWYMNLSAPEFLQSLYTGLSGRLFMTVCMVIYLAAVMWQFSIMENKIG
ncbi:MAG: type II secretion system F family protein [Lachnospiraceae bacterium]